VAAPCGHGACAKGGRPFTLANGSKKGAPPVHSGSGTPRRELYADWGKSQGNWDAYIVKELIQGVATELNFSRSGKQALAAGSTSL